MRHYVLRFLGAFGRGASLLDALRWELTQHEREVAATRLSSLTECDIQRDVALWLAQGSVRRSFPTDVWTEVRGERLVPTRRNHDGNPGHTECICEPRYRGIVLMRPWHQVCVNVRRAVAEAARETSMPVFWWDERVWEESVETGINYFDYLRFRQIIRHDVEMRRVRNLQTR